MNNTTLIRVLNLFVGLLFLVPCAMSGNGRMREIRNYYVPEARQGVAVDQHYFYAVGNQQIAKYAKDTGTRVATWKGNENGPIIHLNSGVIVEGKLYCAHSNYPEVPMTSSIEIWDAETLKHIGSHSFGIRWGSCTWIDWHDGYWWVGFANYDKWKAATSKGSEWTTLVKMNDQWQSLEEWVFPTGIVERFRPMSNSGGSWGPDGLLYCSGHDREEIYTFKEPATGSVLELVETIPIAIYGQGIAWDKYEMGIIYGIRKKDRQVVVFQMVDR